jgi:serine/threonine protein kinase
MKCVLCDWFLPQRSFLNVATQITTTLGRVHLRHIVRKDLKPQNILLCGGGSSPRVELMDFGLSALRTFTADLESVAGSVSDRPLPARAEGTCYTWHLSRVVV